MPPLPKRAAAAFFTPAAEVRIAPVSDECDQDCRYNEGDPNYDLFKLAMRVSAKRLFPNFSFLDAPFNLQGMITRMPLSTS